MTLTDGSVSKSRLWPAFSFSWPADHLEACVVHRVAVRVARVHVGGREVADDRAVGVFGHKCVVQADRGGCLVDVGHGQCEQLVGGQAAGIGTGHGDVDRRFGLEIEALAGLQLQLASDHLEPCVVDRVAVRVARVHVGGREVADNRAVGVFGHKRVVQADRGGRLVDVGHGQCEQLVGGQATGIGTGHGDVDRRLGLEIEALAGLELQLASDHLEACVVHRVAVRVARVHVRGREIADNRAVGVFGHECVVQADRRGRFVDVGHGQCEQLVGGQAAGIGTGHGDVDRRFGLEIEALAGLQLQLAGDHLEACVVDRVAVRVAGVHVGGREIADNRAVGVFGHECVVQADRGGRLVDVGHGQCEQLVGGQAAGVGTGHGDVDRRLGLEIEALAGLQLQLAADHLEPCVVHRVAVRVARVHVRGREVADNRAVGVFGHECVVQADRGGRLVDVGDGQCEQLVGGQATGVGTGHGDVDRRLGLEIEALAGLQLQLASDHLETCVVDRVAVRVARVHVRGREVADNRAVGVFGHECVVQADRGGRLVDVGHGQCEQLVGGQATGIGTGHGDVDRRFGLEIEALAGLQLQLAADHLEPCVVDRVAVRVARVHVGGREIADNRTVGVFGHECVVQADRRGRLVDVGDGQCEQLVGGQAAGIGAGHGDVDRRLGLEIEALAGLELQLASDHLEACVVDRVAVRVARVHVGGREVADNRAVGVFGHKVLSRLIAVGASLTLVTVSANSWLVDRPPASVLVTVTLTDGSVSKSRLWPALSFNWPATTSKRASSTV